MREKNIDWGKRLSDILKEKKISQREAAKIAGISPSVISSWSGGAAPTDFMALQKLCNHLNISFSWMLTGQKENIQHELTITELYEEQTYFDGLARIRIDRLIPRKKTKRDQCD